jgi:hypothetical protein
VSYALNVNNTKGMQITKVVDNKLDSSSTVAYESISAFLTNWTDVVHISDAPKQQLIMKDKNMC